MTSERQRAANRANAQKSTGPKTRAGKRRASQNAYRHGLSGFIERDAGRAAELEALAREIVVSTGGKIDLEHARSIAQAQLELLRIRSMNTGMVKQMLAGCDDSWWSSSAELQRPPALPERAPDASAEAMRLALRGLKLLDRYERRALTRRDRAVRLWLTSAR